MLWLSKLVLPYLADWVRRWNAIVSDYVIGQYVHIASFWVQ